MLSQDTLGTLGAQSRVTEPCGGRGIENRRVTQEAGGKARLKENSPKLHLAEEGKGGSKGGGHFCFWLTSLGITALTFGKGWR